MSSHGALARRLGVEDAMLDELWDYARSERFTKAERAALAAAVAMTREPRAIPDAVWDDLRKHFDDGQIVEIVCTIGLFNYFNRVNNALRIEITKSQD
ncbi:MAG: hypothetical protein JOZ97_06985 [Candidatus Eremiobacteraeota bacterium]|nr:hypothetical protein [Candidatus Eremiobacteraeota bacterium]